MPSPLGARTIALVTRLYAPEPGAASLRLGALVRALRDAGAAVRVLTTTPPAAYTGEPRDHAGVDIRRFPVLRDRNAYVRGYLQYLSFDIPAFFRILFSRGIDAVVVEPPPTTGVAMRFACAIRRKPYIYFAADIWSDAVDGMDTPGFIARTVRRLELFAMNGATTIISASAEFTERMHEMKVSAPIVTVGNGADEHIFRPDGEARDLGHPFLVYAGTASEMHGAGIFIDAVAIARRTHPGVQVVFIGQGAERDQLERSADRAGEGAVRFEPRLSPEETAEWIRGSVATLASVRPEGTYHRMFPVKMYASAACGAPVIYAGTEPGHAFAAQPGFGWAVDYDVDQVAAAMDAALTKPYTPAARRQLAARAAADFSLKAVGDRGVAAVAAVLDARDARKAVRS